MYVHFFWVDLRKLRNRITIRVSNSEWATELLLPQRNKSNSLQNGRKDTIRFPSSVFPLWQSRQVKYDQLGGVRLVDDDLVQFDGCVHSSHVGRFAVAKKC